MATAKLLKIKKSNIEKGVASFKGLPHRLELIRSYEGINYYDNSFATTPESSEMDLQNFKNIILLAGGADKGANFKSFARKIKTNVKYLILFDGQGTKKIYKALLQINFLKDKMEIVDNMKEAFAAVKRQAQKGDTVLLSTGCASFGLFKNYKERGNLFQKEVKKIK